MWFSENKKSTVPLNPKTANDLCLTSCLRFFASRHYDPLRIRLSFSLFIYTDFCKKHFFFCSLSELTFLFSKLQQTKSSKSNLFDLMSFFLRTIRIEYPPFETQSIIHYNLSVSVCMVTLLLLL